MSSRSPRTPRRPINRKRGRSESLENSSDGGTPGPNIAIRGGRASPSAESSLPPSSPPPGLLEDSSDYDVDTDAEIPQNLPDDADDSEGEDLFDEDKESPPAPCSQ